jgi:hypothetical protein
MNVVASSVSFGRAERDVDGCANKVRSSKETIHVTSLEMKD